jgi:hypothetical protein
MTVDYKESPYEKLVNVVWGDARMAVLKVQAIDLDSYDIFGYPDFETFASSIGVVDNGEWKHLNQFDYCCTTGRNQGDVLVAAHDETLFQIIDITEMTGTTGGIDPTHGGQAETYIEVSNLTDVDGYNGFLSSNLLWLGGDRDNYPAGVGAWTDFDYAGHGINPVGDWVLWGNYVTTHRDAVYATKSLWICDFSKHQPTYPDYSGTLIAEKLPEGKFTVRRWIAHEHSNIDVAPESHTDTWELKIYPPGTVFTITDGINYTASKAATFTGSRTSTSYGDVEAIFTFDKNGFVI